MIRAGWWKVKIEEMKKIEAGNCPYGNTDWYDVTDIGTGKKGFNSKICVNLDCPEKENCDKLVTEKGYPFYDPFGEIANSFKRTLL